MVPYLSAAENYKRKENSFEYNKYDAASQNAENLKDNSFSKMKKPQWKAITISLTQKNKKKKEFNESKIYLKNIL